MAFTTGNSNETETVTVTNGTKAVSIAATERSFGVGRTAHVSLTPERATHLAVAILNGAANVRAKIHGSDTGAQYIDVERAREALNYDGLPQEDGLYEDDIYVLYRRARGKWYQGGAADDKAELANWEVSLLAHGELHKLVRA